MSIDFLLCFLQFLHEVKNVWSLGNRLLMKKSTQGAYRGLLIASVDRSGHANEKLRC